MIYYIPKGWHFSLPFIPRVATKEKYIWEVNFHNSCKYDIGAEQLDWNKLVGVSNQINPRTDSVRFVWRYNKLSDAFDIAIYVEKNKKFKVTEIASVKAQENLKLTMHCYSTYTLIEVNGKLEVVDFQKKPIAFRLNPYFGGNIAAPHCMFLKLKTK
jgi:hypothetical protein